MKNISILLFAFLISCYTSNVKFPVSTTIPAAEVTARFSKDKNENYVMDLSAKHLASPDRLPSAKKYYVVWITDANGTSHNAGMLASNQDFSGSLHAVTPYKPKSVFITAEDSGNVTQPGEQVLLRADNLNIRS